MAGDLEFQLRALGQRFGRHRRRRKFPGCLAVARFNSRGSGFAPWVNAPVMEFPSASSFPS